MNAPKTDTKTTAFLKENEKRIDGLRALQCDAQKNPADLAEAFNALAQELKQEMKDKGLNQMHSLSMVDPKNGKLFFDGY